MAGHTGDQASARSALGDRSPDVRASALSALARMGSLGVTDAATGLADPAPGVRRRTCDLAGRFGLAPLTEQLVAALGDQVPSVVEAACYALGELGGATDDAAVVAALAATATAHREPLCREAAVAALGARGGPAGLAAVLAGLSDKPAVRRRAVVALAAFEGAEVDAALNKAAQDADWQVRQTAEDLLGRPRPK